MDRFMSFRAASCDRKLSPVEYIDRGAAKPSPVAAPPFCSSTYVSIEATCPSSCRFKKRGCYVRAGFTGGFSRDLDRAARGVPADAVIMVEAENIRAAFGGKRVPQDGARGGRDLRLHVGGDVTSSKAARWLAAAAEDWHARGGGKVWTYTHRWRQIPRDAWGPAINVLASVETERAAHAAVRRGYAPAITLREFPSDQRFKVGQLRVVPCPAETRGITCVQCRLCVERDLVGMGVAIGFAAHGARNVIGHLRRSLPVLRVSIPKVSARADTQSGVP